MTVELTWLGTNAFELKTPEATILIDPYCGMAGADYTVPVERYLDSDAILVTHGHFDHLSSIPAIMAAKPSLVLCTKIGATTLDQQLEELTSEYKALMQNVVTIAPGDSFEIDDLEVQVTQGKHIRFDVQTVLETLDPANMSRASENVLPLLELIAEYPSAGETVVYDLKVGKDPDAVDKLHIQVMGSLALNGGVDYQTGADFLILPYQGRSDLTVQAIKTIAALKPKAVIVSHFNDSFPPISQEVELDDLREAMANYFPDIPLIIPEFGKPIRL